MGPGNLVGLVEPLARLRSWKVVWDDAHQRVSLAMGNVLWPIRNGRPGRQSKVSGASSFVQWKRDQVAREKERGVLLGRPVSRVMGSSAVIIN